MKHLYFIVEGETEYLFVKNLLLPYLLTQGLEPFMFIKKIEMSGGGHGFNNIEHFRNTVQPILRLKNEPIITTLIDHYGINSEKKLPDFELCKQEQDMDKQISCMEESLAKVVKEIVPNYRFFIPNILKHEMETLLFADAEGFDLETESIKQAIQDVCKQFSDIEDINHTPEGAPSKRLAKIYESNGKRYRKIDNGLIIAELIGIETMLKKAPRFKTWVEKIIQITKNSI
jgi:Domain of unknown function (DUF4276)